MDATKINQHAVAWIESYARCEISLDELHKRMRDALGKRMIHNPHYRVLNLHQICPSRAVRITAQHLEILLAKRRRGEITEQDVRDWAHMVTINDCFFWKPEDDVVGKWVNFLFFDFTPQD